MRNPLRTKNESSDTVAPGITSSVGMGRITSMWATNTMSTAMPRSPSKPGTSPKLRGGSRPSGGTGGSAGPDVDTSVTIVPMSWPYPPRLGIQTH